MVNKIFLLHYKIFIIYFNIYVQFEFLFHSNLSLIKKIERIYINFIINLLIY